LEIQNGFNLPVQFLLGMGVLYQSGFSKYFFELPPEQLLGGNQTNI
jgi:hypothetical protein